MKDFDIKDLELEENLIEEEIIEEDIVAEEIESDKQEIAVEVEVEEEKPSEPLKMCPNCRESFPANFDNFKLNKQNKMICNKCADELNKPEPNKWGSHLAMHRYKMKKMNIPGTLTDEDWNNILNFFNNSCAYCGSTENIGAEFINTPPIGGFELGNVVCACGHCVGLRNHVDIRLFAANHHKNLNKINDYLESIGF